MDVEETWGMKVLREARERRAALRRELGEVEVVIAALGGLESVLPPAEPVGAPEVEEEPAAPEEPAEGPEEPGREIVEIPIEEPEPEKAKAKPLTAEERLARDQRVLDYLVANGPTERLVLGKATGVPSGTWGSLVPRMEEQYGLVSTTLPTPGAGKRNRVAVLSLPGQEIPSVPPTGPSSARKLTAELVRDAICGTKLRDAEAFGAPDVIVGLPEEVIRPFGSRLDLVEAVERWLYAFAKGSGIIDEAGPKMYRYVSPAEAAKRNPAPRAKEKPAARTNGGPVPGTGPTTGATPEVKRLLRAVRNAGGAYDHRGEHILVRVGAGSCRIASTPGSPSSFRDDRQKLRRLGVDV